MGGTYDATVASITMGASGDLTKRARSMRSNGYRRNAMNSGVSGSENACGKAFEIECPFFTCDGCPLNPKEQEECE